MGPKHYLPAAISAYLPRNREELIRFLGRHRYRLALLLVGIWVLQNKDVSIDVSFSGDGLSIVSQDERTTWTEEEEVSEEFSANATGAQNVSLLTRKKSEPAKKQVRKATPPPTRTRTAAEEEKRQRQLAYVERFHKAAQSERDQYGIPASITLAQGLLESDIGKSKLATRNNNHFGIKCFSRSCRQGHCSNFTDDSHKDFFRIYKNAWESYRAHSQLLRGKRYNHLFKLGKTDYEGWAFGLKKAGYATDPAYAEKLIGLIEDLGLHQYD